MTAYEKHLAEFDKTRENIVSMKPAFDLMESISKEVGGTIGMNSFFDTVVFKMVVSDLKDVLPVLRRVRASGRTMEHHADCPDTRTRLYIFGDIRVDAVLTGGSCRFEKIGVKETPVYSVVCEDGTNGFSEELSDFDAVTA